jgi:radical SAM superfamily enzyme YgiQ (UPF0313 family)
MIKFSDKQLAIPKLMRPVYLVTAGQSKFDRAFPDQWTEELVAAMANAGCEKVALRFESGLLRVLREMNKRYSPDEVRQISDLLRAHVTRRFGFLLPG